MESTRKIQVNGIEAEMNVKVTDENITSTFIFVIDGKESISTKTTARNPGGVKALSLNANASQFLDMWNRHDQEHRAVVEEVRSVDGHARG